MPREGVGWYLKDVVLQFLERRHAKDFLLRHGVTEDKVTKAHVLLHQMVQVYIHLRGVLIDEVEALGLGLLTVGRLLRIEDEGYIFIAPANLTQQLQACLGIPFFHMAQPSGGDLHREAGVADDAEGILVILLIDLHRLLIVRGQHHLRPASFALGGSMGVEGLGRKTLRLGKDIVIEVRQHGGVETDVVLHEQDHLHTGLTDVVVDVHLVLQQLDDGEDEVGIAKPTEHIVEDRHILVLDTLGDTMGKGSEHHTWDIRVGGLHLSSHGERIVVGITRHTDHQVDIRRMQHLIGLLGGRHLGKRRGIAQSQFHIFIEEFLVDTAVVLEHKSIVGIGHDQHIEDATRHQVDERHILQVELVPLLWYLVNFFHHRF